MFAIATSGDQENNKKFSAVLDAVVDERKHNCFQKNNGAFCGNKIVEEGEKCDCSFDESECAEQCSYPRTFDGNNQLNDRSCKLKPGVQCCPCCDNQCNYIRASHGVMFRAEQDCTQSSK